MSCCDYLGGSLTYDSDNSKIVTGATIRCYNCCCVSLTLGDDVPTKYVNSIWLAATPKFLRDLREKERYYGSAFGVIPNSEKQALFKSFLQEQYQADSFHINLEEKSDLHLFLPCFLKLCSKKKSRKLVRYNGWAPNDVKKFRTMQLHTVGGSRIVIKRN